MSDRPVLDEAVKDLLTAAAAALDLPLPALSRESEVAHYHLLELRAMGVRAALSALADFWHPGSVAETAADLRRQTDRQPVDYAPFVFRGKGAE
ncbi:hypothetical protein ACFYXM_13720 [Streptomyces sp. NPDC002476]|uniref:hypothetical protein n=1 Tax=Streptomyces sp. NPDC002476 TaxID=3364648 RepID=UPI0036CDEE64